MKRIGIYGGTFNPPHLGHIRAAEYALKELSLDQLLLIPTCVSPHKQIPYGSPTPQQRLAMLQVAAGENPAITVSGMELERGGASYTYETLEQLKRQYPDEELVFLMGTDMFLSFESWRNPGRILELASLGVFCRGDKDEKLQIAHMQAHLEQRGGRVYVLENPVTQISSTQLRRLLVFRCAAPFLPDGVEAYIHREKLYGTDKDYRNLPMEQLEQTVVSLLDPNRVRHVLGCRDTAAQMAKVWGVDETDAARAGLLHDITKALDGPLQLTLCSEYDKVLGDFARKNPKTLHALTGSLVAERIFGECQAVVDAIATHTTGAPNMNTLQKIIYVADYMEPNRDFPGVEELRRLAYTDLDGALKLGLEMTIEVLKQQGREISPESAQALAYLNNLSR